MEANGIAALDRILTRRETAVEDESFGCAAALDKLVAGRQLEARIYPPSSPPPFVRSFLVINSSRAGNEIHVHAPACANCATNRRQRITTKQLK